MGIEITISESDYETLLNIVFSQRDRKVYFISGYGSCEELPPMPLREFLTALNITLDDCQKAFEVWEEDLVPSHLKQAYKLLIDAEQQFNEIAKLKPNCTGQIMTFTGVCDLDEACDCVITASTILKKRIDTMDADNAN